MGHFRFLLIPAANTCSRGLCWYIVELFTSVSFFPFLWLFLFQHYKLYIPLLLTHCDGLWRIKTVQNSIWIWTSVVLSREESFCCDFFFFYFLAYLFYFPLLLRRYQLKQVSSIRRRNCRFCSLFLDFLFDSYLT